MGISLIGERSALTFSTMIAWPPREMFFVYNTARNVSIRSCRSPIGRLREHELPRGSIPPLFSPSRFHCSCHSIYKDMDLLERVIGVSVGIACQTIALHGLRSMVSDLGGALSAFKASWRVSWKAARKALYTGECIRRLPPLQTSIPPVSDIIQTLHVLCLCIYLGSNPHTLYLDSYCLRPQRCILGMAQHRCMDEGL